MGEWLTEKITDLPCRHHNRPSELFIWVDKIGDQWKCDCGQVFVVIVDKYGDGWNWIKLETLLADPNAFED